MRRVSEEARTDAFLYSPPLEGRRGAPGWSDVTFNNPVSLNHPVRLCLPPLQRRGIIFYAVCQVYKFKKKQPLGFPAKWLQFLGARGQNRTGTPCGGRF